MKCQNCGNEVRAGSAFCTSCGTRVGDVPASTGAVVNDSAPVPQETPSVSSIPELPQMPVLPKNPAMPSDPVTPVAPPGQPLTEQTAVTEAPGQPPGTQPVATEAPGQPQGTQMPYTHQAGQQFYQPYQQSPDTPPGWSAHSAAQQNPWAQNTPAGPKKAKKGLIIGLVVGGVLLIVAAVIIGLVLGRLFAESLDDFEQPVYELEQEDIEAEAVITDEQSFDLLMDEVFADWVSSDTLSMNYFLADPYVLNIERPEATFGEVVSPETIEESKQETQEMSERLDDIDYYLLRDDQQIVYDILRRNIEISRILEREDDFSYYTGYIRPLNGIQVQLPVLLAEFSFYTAEDIGRYLDLIEDTHRYFSDIIEFERERSRRGFFLSEANVDSVIEQIESYLENREDNLLITVFNDRIDNYPGLSDQQREQYKQRNEELVLGNVLAAYDSLLDAMKELRGVGAKPGGLAELPDGSEFAHARLRIRVGTDKSATDLDFLFEDWLNDTWISVMSKIHGNPEIGRKLAEGSLGQIEEGTPEAIISDLRNHTALYFPPVGETNLTVLEVHESLQEHMSPAFYLTPAIDRFNENVVYVNPSSVNENLFLFTVLAHESYPGHMYQTVYFFQQSPHPVRLALSNTGYSEGWATYAEMVSYFFTDLDEDEAELMWEFRFFDMLMGGYADLGINILGWSFEDLQHFLEGFGLDSRETAENIYNMVTGVPLMQITYSLGFIELMELMDEAQHLQGYDFDFMGFHRFFLETGPAPFPIIRDRMISEIVGSASGELRPAA